MDRDDVVSGKVEAGCADEQRPRALISWQAPSNGSDPRDQRHWTGRIAIRRLSLTNRPEKGIVVSCRIRHEFKE